MSHASLTRTLGGFVLGAVLVFAGCRSIEEMAPPVDETLLSSPAAAGAPADRLERGRKIYLKQCITCHTVQPVDGWTIAEWEKILPEMNEEAHLKPAESEDLWTYIRTARAHLAANKPAAK
jgi:mono/diheme cytochrome c family protein